MISLPTESNENYFLLFLKINHILFNFFNFFKILSHKVKPQNLYSELKFNSKF